MLFNSLQFLIFFPIVAFLYFQIPHRHRWVLLLAASYYFYASWKFEYLGLIIISTLADYGLAIWMAQAERTSARRGILALSLSVNLGLLFSFKYLSFFSDQINLLLSLGDMGTRLPTFDILLPVGISFYTFQTLSYSIDVYQRKREPERHLGYFALYVSFFPQLVAGPIERSSRLLPQFFQEHKFDTGRISSGLRLMLWGFFKKLVIADRLAVYVNQVYNNLGDHQPEQILLATYFFTFQIYCDFSGYSDIAIGGARVMGFDLMKNFDRPYFSQSIAEFWRRWHISLSTWFRDYLYIPLGGNRVSRPRWYVNLMVVFLLSGMWHGADWTFLVWGLLHGAYLASSVWTAETRRSIQTSSGLNRYPRLLSFVRTVITFHLVVIGWVFFRASSLAEAVYVFSEVFSSSWDLARLQLLLPQFVGSELIIAFGSLSILIISDLVRSRVALGALIARQSIAVRWGGCYVFTMTIIYFGKFASHEQFIYFQF